MNCIYKGEPAHEALPNNFYCDRHRPRPGRILTMTSSSYIAVESVRLTVDCVDSIQMSSSLRALGLETDVELTWLRKVIAFNPEIGLARIEHIIEPSALKTITFDSTVDRVTNIILANALPRIGIE